MSNYYEILGIDRSATSVEIKKGYFTMVRRYSPERFPDKFMEVRNAYETLSNDKTKTEYDQVISMSNFVRSNFEHAERLLENGNYKKQLPYFNN